MKNIKETLKKLLTSFPLFAVILIILFVVIPFPILVIDIFIGINLLFALWLLILVLNNSDISKISLFPTFLLISTILTLVINVSVTRPILTKGSEFNDRIICTVSKIFTSTGNNIHLWVGFIFFILFLIFMIVVIIKSMTRAVEVAARLTLDSMQIKMMAIEVEYSSGVITEEQVKQRKAEVQEEFDFYSALDGCTKFISGNAKIIVFIIFSIILGGTTIDYFINDVVFIDAVKTYIHLSVGAGIVFILPVFIISLAVGISVTRLASPDIN